MTEDTIDPEHLARRLGAIADEIEQHTIATDRLYAERADLWRKGRAAGVKPPALARLSRVQAVTVRALIDRGH